MKIFGVGYDDGECHQILGYFFTEVEAKRYLKYFKEVDEESWIGYLPDIFEVEIVNIDRPYFHRVVRLNKRGEFHRRSMIDMTTRRHYCQLLFEPGIYISSDSLRYSTATLNKKDAENEALAAWMCCKIEDKFPLEENRVIDLTDSFGGDLWMARGFDV